MVQQVDLTVYELGDLRLFLLNEKHFLPLEEILSILKPGYWIDISILQAWCK
jgi:hypothetical protein